MAYWWVNQNKTWRHEIFGEYLWAPKLKANGQRSVFYDNMTRLEPGDVVFSHFKGALRYVGVVVHRAVSDPKPDFGFAGSTWDDDGWSVEMRFTELPQIVQPKDHLRFYNEVGPKTHAPMNDSGHVNMEYLYALPDSLGEHYLQLGGLNESAVEDVVTFDPSVEQLLDEAEEVLSDPKLTTTERHVLARARLGQGIFKEEVRRIEPACRLTGVNEPRHLIASHMKPWAKSNNVERLDGNNGLLLSPHVDHLFDRGLITFTKAGRVMVSKQLNAAVPTLWKLDLDQHGHSFRKGQLPYLEYHQDQVFRSG